MTRRILALAVVLPLALAACASPPGTDDPSTAEVAVVQRLDAIDAAVAEWRDAGTLPEAKAAAELALNLVVGPDNPLYGDGDGDGTVRGLRQELGLLPGLVWGGIAQDAADNPCVEADVLGGSWADPAARWDEAQAVYDAWTPERNTMPTLASHPQRVVGWATLTLALDDAAPGALETAHEYAGHAGLHVDVSREAVEGCSG